MWSPLNCSILSSKLISGTKNTQIIKQSAQGHTPWYDKSRRPGLSAEVWHFISCAALCPTSTAKVSFTAFWVIYKEHLIFIWKPLFPENTNQSGHYTGSPRRCKPCLNESFAGGSTSDSCQWHVLHATIVQALWIKWETMHEYFQLPSSQASAQDGTKHSQIGVNFTPVNMVVSRLGILDVKEILRENTAAVYHDLNSSYWVSNHFPVVGQEWIYAIEIMNYSRNHLVNSRGIALGEDNSVDRGKALIHCNIIS